MQLIKANNMGFCFGVRRAVDMALIEAEKHGKVYTLGELIHNREVVSELASHGVIPVDSPDMCESGATIVIRSHGVPPKLIEDCRAAGYNVVDCTCPFVMKIHDIVSKAYGEGYQIIVSGNERHPECIGINGCCDYKALFCGSFTADTAEACFEQNVLSAFPREARLCLVSQTTFDRAAFEALAELIRCYYPNAVVHDTVCNTTRERQLEAAKLSSKCDVMLVLGDHHSSNTQKLAAICEENCKKVKRIANINEFPLDIIKTDGIIVGVVAGASTPDSLIREVITRMSEQEKATVDCCTAENTIENVAQAATETAEQVVETVEAVAETVENAEAAVTETVDKVEEAAAEAVETVAAAAQEPVVEEGETTFEEAFEKTLVRIRNGQILTGSVVQIVDGEVCVNIGYKSDGFIPRDEFSSDPDVDPAAVVSVGDKIEVEVLKVNDGEGNVLLSRKNVESKKVWDEFSTDADSEGKIVEAIGKEVVKGGLIANINGIRAFIPASQVSNRFVEKLDEFVGQPLKVKILEVDKQRKRVVASRKAVLVAEAEEAKRKKWAELVVGEKVHGIVRIVSFGAFVALEPTIDGLIHISQVGARRVTKIEDEINVGDIVRCKVLEVNPEQRRISLSRRDVLLEEDPELAEQLRIEKEERERAAAERAERRAQEAQNRQQQAQQREERRRERPERTERPDRPERRRREDADYELPPVQSSTTSLANLLGDFSAPTEEQGEN